MKGRKAPDGQIHSGIFPGNDYFFISDRGFTDLRNTEKEVVLCLRLVFAFFSRCGDSWVIEGVGRFQLSDTLVPVQVSPDGQPVVIRIFESDGYRYSLPDLVRVGSDRVPVLFVRIKDEQNGMADFPGSGDIFSGEHIHHFYSYEIHFFTLLQTFTNTTCLSPDQQQQNDGSDCRSYHSTSCSSGPSQPSVVTVTSTAAGSPGPSGSVVPLPNFFNVTFNI